MVSYSFPMPGTAADKLFRVQKKPTFSGRLMELGSFSFRYVGALQIERVQLQREIAARRLGDASGDASDG